MRANHDQRRGGDFCADIECMDGRKNIEGRFERVRISDAILSYIVEMTDEQIKTVYYRMPKDGKAFPRMDANQIIWSGAMQHWYQASNGEAWDMVSVVGAKAFLRRLKKCDENAYREVIGRIFKDTRPSDEPLDPRGLKGAFEKAAPSVHTDSWESYSKYERIQ